MNKIFFLLACLSLGFTNCNKDESNEVPTGSLKIKLVNNLNKAMTSTLVELFKSQADFTNKTNLVASQMSDTFGYVTFSKIPISVYYWLASKGCQNNYNGKTKTPVAITVNGSDTASSVLISTGTLSFLNISPDPYHVYYNGVLVFDVAAGAPKSLVNLPLGNYTARVLQISGFTTTPIDKSYSGTIKCNQQSTITFP